MRFAEIPLEKIIRKSNVREERETELTDLETSIDNWDILQPLLVRPSAGKYEIICGHRRYEAARRYGAATIPCYIRDDISEHDVLYVQLVENTNRKQMSAQELVDTFDRMKKQEPRLTNREIARRIGKPEQFVTSQYTAIRMVDEMYGDTKRADIKKKTSGQIMSDYKKKLQTVLKNGTGTMILSYHARTIQISCVSADKAEEIVKTLKTKYHLEDAE